MSLCLEDRSGQTVCGGGKSQTGLLKTYLKTSHSLDRKEVGGDISDSVCESVTKKAESHS